MANAPAADARAFTWFRRRRYGMFVHMAIATVPAFAPVQEYSEWYWSHLSPSPLDDVILHPAPMPEVQAWHAQHHPGRSYDDFIDDLTMSAWDADALAQLAVDAGMGYVVHTSKHHDGYCFFDSALTTRTTMHSGPRRDPVGELADASRKAGLVYGLYYSLLDWSHPDYGTPAYVAGYLHPQVRELIDKYAPAVLWGDGHWGRPPSYWRSDELLEHYTDTVHDGLVNDRWGATKADFVTFEYETPVATPPTAFEVCRAVGYSFGWNRAERIADHLSASQLIDLLTETVAKGGNLLLDVGPRADGSVPEEQSKVLRAAGAWVNANADVIDGSAPFESWGDDSVRYTVTPSDDGCVHLNAIDLAAAHIRRFTAIDHARWELVDPPADTELDRGGLLARRPTGTASALAAVHRVVLRPRAASPVQVAALSAAGIDDGVLTFASIAAALAAAGPGDVIDVAEGTWIPDGTPLPMCVPAAVTLRGRRHSVLDGRGTDAAALVAITGDDASVTGITITGVSSPGFGSPATGVLVEGVQRAQITDCTLIQSSIVVSSSPSASLVANRLDGGAVIVGGSADTHVRNNVQRANRWGDGISISASRAVVVVANEVTDDLTGIRISNCTDALVTSNTVRTRWWGVHLDHSCEAAVSANQISATMRAICITGGSDNRVGANRINGCDSGLLVEAGATGTAAVDNTFVACRLATFVWEAEEPDAHDNHVIDTPAPPT